MKKYIRNINVVTCKLWTALIKVTNHKLEVARKKKQKIEKIVKKQKTKTMVAKYQRARDEICLSNKEEGNYKNNIRHKIDSDQTNNKYQLLN